MMENRQNQAQSPKMPPMVRVEIDVRPKHKPVTFRTYLRAGHVHVQSNMVLTPLQVAFAEAAARSHLDHLAGSLTFEVEVPAHEDLVAQVKAWSEELGEQIMEAERRGSPESTHHLAWILSARVVDFPYNTHDAIRATVARLALAYAESVWRSYQQQNPQDFSF